MGVLHMKNLIVLSVLVLLFLNTSLYCQVPLCPGDCDKLTPEARKHYNQALEHIDRVYWKGALEEMRAAAKADPDHVNLHFLLARIARKRGKVTSNLEESQKYYTIAENALLVIQKKENLNKEQLMYLESALEQTKREKASLVQRQKRRLDVGYKIIMDYMKNIGRIQEEKKEEESVAALPEAAAAAPSSSPFGSAPVSPSPFGASPSPDSGISPFGASPSAAPSADASSPFSVSPSAPSTPPSTGSSSSPFDVSNNSTPANASPSSTDTGNPFGAF